MHRDVKPLKRKWAKIYWGCAAGLLLSLVLFLGSRGNFLCAVPFAAFLAGIVVSQEQLRCPCCGRNLSSIPRIRKSGGQCRYCGRDIVYDDEMGRRGGSGGGDRN